MGKQKCTEQSWTSATVGNWNGVGSKDNGNKPTNKIKAGPCGDQDNSVLLVEEYN